MDTLKQIQNEITMGKDFIDNKRKIWLERLDKYVDQDKDEEKIGINTIYATMQLGLAIRYTDDTTVLFSPRKFGDEEYADNLSSLAIFDAEETERKIKKYQMDWDTQFFGYSIERNRGRDKVKQVTETSIEDPFTHIPDPYSDHLTLPRFHYFEVEMLKSQMTEEAGYNQEFVDELTEGESEDIKRTKTYKNEATGLNNIIEDTSEDFYVTVFEGIRYKDGDLYIVTVDVNQQTILREVKIEPITKEEIEADYVDIRTQVNISWFSPMRGTPVGVSLIDLIVDKQKGQSILANLRLIDAKFSTFGQINLVNTDIVKNTADLTAPSTKTKWIGVNAGNVSLSNAVYPVPRHSIMADSYNASADLSKQIQLDTGIDSNTLGVGGGVNQTLGESQQVQANANIRLALGISISNWGEINFWRFMWLRGYEEYFEESEVKFVRVANGFDSRPIEFRRDDFIGGISPEIKIESKSNISAKREKEKLSFMSTAPYFLQDPTIAKVIKRLALRYLMKLQGTPREYIKLLTYDRDEETAKHKLILINNGDITGAIIDSMGEDHQTFLVIFEGAIDSPIKQKAIQARKEAYMLSGQMLQQQTAGAENQGDGMINAMQSQTTSAIVADGLNKTPESIGNIAQGV